MHRQRASAVKNTINRRQKNLPAKALGFDAVNGASQARNLARGLLPVHGALAGSLGKHGSGGHQSFIGLSLVGGRDGGTHLFDGVLHAGTGGAVTTGPLQALPVTLDG